MIYSYAKFIKLNIFLVPIVLLIAACKPVQPVFNARINTQDGLVELSIVSVDLETAEKAVKAIEEDFAYLDNNWRVGGTGDLSLVNRLLPTGQVITIPPSLLPLIGLAQRFATASGGLFDPAIGSLMQIWGFHAPPVEYRVIPSTRQIGAILQADPKMRDLDVNRLQLRSNNPKINLDFSGMLRGYGVDLAIARLRELKIHSAIVKFGAVMRAIGNRDGQPWRIPIHRPAGGRVLGFIYLNGDESLVTLGSHERSFLYRSRRYHELLDPRTGYPAMETVAVTVLHKNAVTADAAANAIFIAGPKDWLQIAASMETKQVLLIDTFGVFHMTQEMMDRLQIIDEEPNIHLSKLPASVLK